MQTQLLKRNKVSYHERLSSEHVEERDDFNLQDIRVLREDP